MPEITTEPQQQAPNLTIGDLVLSAQIVQAAAAKGVFRPEEMKNGYTKYVAYYPTDAGPMQPSWVKMLNEEFDAQVCYSNYAERVYLQSNNNKRPANLYQIYHGVDTEIFKNALDFGQQGGAGVLPGIYCHHVSKPAGQQIGSGKAFLEIADE